MSEKLLPISCTGPALQYCWRIFTGDAAGPASAARLAMGDDVARKIIACINVTHAHSD
jgi:hypothetical protein